MAQPPTAAIAVACIFAGLAALYFSYRIYLKIYNRGARKLAEQQQQQEAQLALSSSHSAKYPPSAPIASAFHNNHRPAYTPFHHHHFSSSHSTNPQTTYNTNNTTQVNTFSSSTTSATNKSLLHPQTATPSPLQSNSSSSLSSSAIASPTTDQTSTQQLHDAVVAAAVLNSEADPQHQPTPAPLPITLGSNTTTGAIQRQYAAARQYGTAPNGTLTPSALATLGSNGGAAAATNGPGSVYAGSEGNGSAAGNGNAGSVLGVPSLYGGQRIKRESYLPHLNRDAMQIVTPSPLGFGLGGMATATDQRTLAFSKASGIGDHESLLSDPLLSSTIVPGAPNGNAQGGPPSAGGAGAPPSGEWEQRINAYRTGAASAGGSSVGHAPRGSVSSLSGVVGPGPSTNTPAAEYLAQQQRQLRLNASGQQQQQQQQHQQPHTMTPTSRRSNGPSGSSPSSPAPPPSSYRPPPLNTMYAGPPRAPSPSRSSPQSSTGPPSSAVPDLEEQRRLSALTARQSPLQRMSSGEIWSENAK